MRKISPAGKDFIKKWEGLRLNAYLCPAGVWTIGYGSTMLDGRPVKKGDRITREKAEQLLDHEIAEKITDIYTVTNVNAINKLTQAQMDALISFVFNVGVGTYRYGSRAGAKSKKGTGSVWAAVMAGSPQAMAMGLRRYVLAAGKVSPGLKKRREEEAKMVLSSAVVQPPAPDVPAPLPPVHPAPDVPPPPPAPERNWGAISISGIIIGIIIGIISWIIGGPT